MGSLGCRAFLSLSRGDQISDLVTVDIIVESLRYCLAARAMEVEHHLTSVSLLHVQGSSRTELLDPGQLPHYSGAGQGTHDTYINYGLREAR